MFTSWQWVSDLWNIHFSANQVWFWEKVDGAAGWLVTRPEWLLAQALPIQALCILVYLAVGFWLARNYWRDHGRTHPVWRTTAGSAIFVGWPALSYAYLTMGVMLFYAAWLVYGFVVSTIVLFYGTLLEGGWKLITAPFS